MTVLEIGEHGRPVAVGVTIAAVRQHAIAALGAPRLPTERQHGRFFVGVVLRLVVVQHAQNSHGHAHDIRGRHSVAQDKQRQRNNKDAFTGVANRVCQGRYQRQYTERDDVLHPIKGAI